MRLRRSSAFLLAVSTSAVAVASDAPDGCAQLPATIGTHANNRAPCSRLPPDPLRAPLLAPGIEPVSTSAHAFTGLIRGEFPKWALVAKATGARAD